MAFETFGVCGPDTLRFLDKVGGIAAERRQEPREQRWLMERLSIAIFRCNATAILSASPNSHCRRDMNSYLALDVCIIVLIFALLNSKGKMYYLFRRKNKA